jgi:hypothetical protein
VLIEREGTKLGSNCPFFLGRKVLFLKTCIQGMAKGSWQFSKEGSNID